MSTGLELDKKWGCVSDRFYSISNSTPFSALLHLILYSASNSTPSPKIAVSKNQSAKKISKKNQKFTPAKKNHQICI